MSVSVEPLLELLAELEAELTASGPNAVSPFVSDDHFDDWALRIHSAQRRAYPALERFWTSRGAEDPGHWSHIPPVAAEAFKSLPLGPVEAEAVFRTSGTSGGPSIRGEHRIASLSLYRAAARGPYRSALFLDVTEVDILSLIPHPKAAPHSSLARMAGFMAEEPEVMDVVWHFEPDLGVKADETVHWLQTAEGIGRPVLVLTTALALVQLLDLLGDRPVRLPAGSTLMETGGFKGVSVTVERDQLYRLVTSRLGIPEARIVGEYGMTELLSQSYDAQAGTGPTSDRRSHRFPPWVRTRVLDPASLEPVGAGLPGLLCHFDLANAGSVCHVLTQDLGVMDDAGRFRLLGRASGAEARGCSLMAESFVRSVRDRS